MPTIRYQISNEYGLADPELHRAADKDDPEAILEGVAMAGLVGVLRQLGDLAEFAAEIFRDLHEEVMGTAARGHGLMLRMQQLEADVPLVEKAILSQSGPSNYTYNDGIDWHCNIHIDQNIVTQGDMPRFVLDSYEECRGPPRLFTLDKFDTAGAGACLKRYTDPSFFKMDPVSSGLTETQTPREKKSRKTRKKGSRWKNGQTLESLFSPQANSNAQPTSDQVAGKSATKLVRLKARNLNETSGDTEGNLRKSLLQLHSDYQKAAFDHSRSSSNANQQPVDSSESTSEMHEIVMDMSANHPLVAGVSPTMKPNKGSARSTLYELHDWVIEGKEFSEGPYEPFAKGENPHKGINFVENEERFTDSDNISEGSAYDNELSNIVKTTSLPVMDHRIVGVELKLEGSTDGDRTEDIGSEQENFMDALNSMESEVEVDSENKGGPYIDNLGKETHKMSIQTSETTEQLPTEVSEPDGTEVSFVSSVLNNVSKMENSVATTQEKIVVSDSLNSEFCLGQTHDENCLLPNDEAAWTTECVSDNSMLRSQEIGKEHCSSIDASSTSDFIRGSPRESFEALHSAPAYQNDKPTSHEAELGTHQAVNSLDGSPYPDQHFPEKAHAEEVVKEDRTTMPETFHHVSCSPNRIVLTEDSDCEDLLCATLPIGEEMQDLVDQETNAFSSKEDTTNSGKGSISIAISDFAPVISMDDVQHDEIATGTSNSQYLKESTTEAYDDYVKGIDDIAVAKNVNGPSVGNKDEDISEKPDFACNSAELILGEMTLNHDLSDHLSKANDGSTLVGNFVHDIEVPSHPLNATIGKPLDLLNQYAEVCPTETAFPVVPVIAATSADSTAGFEDTVVKNLEVGFENADYVAKSDLEMPKILQPYLEYFSDSEESPEVNSAEELQESSRVNYAEQLPLHPEGGSFPDRSTNSLMLVDDNFKMLNEIIQDGPHGNVQDLKNLTPEYFASEDEANCSDLPMVNKQDATGHQLQPLGGSTDITYQHKLKTHETCSLQTTEACQGVEESAPEPVETCLEFPVQDFDSVCVAEAKNLIAENLASKDETNYCNHPLAYAQEAAAHGPLLLEDGNEVPHQYQLKIDEICSLRTMEAVESQNTLKEEVCPGAEESTPEHARTCLECPVQDFYSKCLAQGEHENAKQEMSLFTKLNFVPASLHEEFSTSQASNEVKVVLGSLNQMAECPEPAVPSNSIDLHDKPPGVEPNHHAPLSILYEDLNMPTLNAGETIQLPSEAPVLSECSSEISACHVAYNLPGVNFPSMSSSDISVAESTSRMLHKPHSDKSTSCFLSQNPEESPPLPPLPPLGWRSRKLQVNSFVSDDNSFQSLAGANPFMTSSDNKSANLFLAPPKVDQQYQLDSRSFAGNNLDSSKVTSAISSSLEHEKSLYAPAAEEELKLSLADSFTPLSPSESQISQHSTVQEERIQSEPDKLHNQLWSGLELEKSYYSEHTRLSFEKEMIQSQNPFVIQSTAEEESHQHNCGDTGGENVHLMKPIELALSSGLEMPQPGFVYSLEGSQHTIFGVGPPKEDELFGIRPRSIRNRPRNPLMEAVVAHDRSTLRKVSGIAKPNNESRADEKDALLQSNILQLRKVPEIVKPSSNNNPEAEGKDALLEQIRNKSFSLKPAVTTKPSNKSHSTNITVAAIVEKANALRQAMAGSDEEDAGDNWSDC